MYCLFNLGKTTCITEDLLQMLMGINTGKGKLLFIFLDVR